MISLMLMLLLPFSFKAEAAAELSATEMYLVKGQQKTLKITGTSARTAWSSSNKKVATVSSGGKVKAISKGSCNITAKVGRSSYKCQVYVETPKLSRTSMSLQAGGKGELRISGTNQFVSWSSSNTRVAEVASRQGDNTEVKAKASGTATIKATLECGKVYSCKVTVKKGASGNNAANVVRAIRANGEYDADYDDYYLYTMPDDSNMFAIYAHSDGLIEFSYYVTSEDAKFLLYIDPYNPKKSTVSAAYYTDHDPDSDPVLTAQANINPARITANTRSFAFRVTDAASGFGFRMESRFIALCNKAMYQALAYWDALLYSETGYRLSDIGFTSYHR